MEYCYETHEEMNIDYQMNGNLLIGTKRGYNGPKLIFHTFNCDTLEIIRDKIPQYVEYCDLKTASSFFVDLRCIYLIDVENNQYAKSCNFPYMIHEIDGNHITYCRQNNHIYIFHSHTESYDTGVFIFDIQNNTLKNPECKSLHELDIISCCVANDDIRLVLEDGIYSYDIESDKLMMMIEISNIYNITMTKNVTFVRDFDKHGSIFIGSEMFKQMEFCPIENIITFFNVYDDKLMSVSLYYDYLNLRRPVTEIARHDIKKLIS